MGRVHNSTNSVNPFIIGGKQPLDVRTVLQTSEDLKDRAIMSSAYKGMVVYIVDDDSLYVCHTESNRKLTNIEDGWRKIDNDYSVRIVESTDNLIDGTSILFPYQGMMAYVTSEDSLYILLTKGNAKSRDINNWKKISVTPSLSLDKVGVNVAPEGGSGFKITENKDVIVEDYTNVENYIKGKYFYTSKGVNSYDEDLNFRYDSLRLSKGGESYIELYNNGDNWIFINDPDNSLGLSELSGKVFTKETSVRFGVDIKFTDGWVISYGDISRPFVESDYELIDIYRSEYSPEIYAYLKDIDVRLLTEDDLIEIDDKIDNLAHLIMIDLNATPSVPDKPEDGDSDIPGDSDGCDSDYEGDSDGCDSDYPDKPEDDDKPEGGVPNTPNPVPLQQVIVQMNNSITKLEQTLVEPDTIEESEIDKLFS